MKITNSSKFTWSIRFCKIVCSCQKDCLFHHHPSFLSFHQNSQLSIRLAYLLRITKRSLLHTNQWQYHDKWNYFLLNIWWHLINSVTNLPQNKRGFKEKFCFNFTKIKLSIDNILFNRITNVWKIYCEIFFIF